MPTTYDNLPPVSLVHSVLQSGAVVGTVYGPLVFFDDFHFIVAHKDRLDLYGVHFQDKDEENIHEEPSDNEDAEADTDNDKGMVFRASLPFYNQEIVSIAPLHAQSSSELTWICVVFASHQIRLINLNPYDYTLDHFRQDVPVNDEYENLIVNNSFISAPIDLHPRGSPYASWRSMYVPNMRTGSFNVRDQPVYDTEDKEVKSKHITSNLEAVPRDELGVSIAVDQSTHTIAINAYKNLINVINLDLKRLVATRDIDVVEVPRKRVETDVEWQTDSIQRTKLFFTPNKFHIQSMAFLKETKFPALMILSMPEYYTTALDIFSLDFFSDLVTKRTDTLTSPVLNQHVLIPNNGPFGGAFLVGMNHITLFRSPPNDTSVIITLDQLEKKGYTPSEYPQPFPTSEEPSWKEIDPNKLHFPYAQIRKDVKSNKLHMSLFVGTQNVAFQSPIQSFAVIDTERTLLGDSEGRIYIMVALQKVGKFPADFRIAIKYLGRTSQASSLEYLASSYFFAGSMTDDSVLLSIDVKVTGKHVEDRKKKRKRPTSQVTVDAGLTEIQRIESMAPIIDFAASSPYTKYKQYPVDKRNRQYVRDFLYAACGSAGTSRIKQLKPGLFTTTAHSEDESLLPIRQYSFDEDIKVFPIDVYGSYLLSTSSSTEIHLAPSLDKSYKKELESLFVTDEPTVYFHRFTTDATEYLYQFTHSQIHAINLSEKSVAKIWETLDQGIITGASVWYKSPSNVVLCFDHCKIAHFSITQGNLQPVSEKRFEAKPGKISPRIKKILYCSNWLFVLLSEGSKNDYDVLQVYDIHYNFEPITIDFMQISDIYDIEFQNVCGENGKEFFILYVTTTNGEVKVINVPLPGENRSEFQIIHEMFLSSQKIDLFGSSEDQTGLIHARSGPDIFFFKVSLLNHKLSVAYIPLLLEQGIDPLSIAYYSSRPALKKNDTSYIPWSDVYSTHSWIIFVTTQDNEVVPLVVDKQRGLGYKISEQRLPIDKVARKLKLSPSGRYLVCAVVCNLNAKDGPIYTTLKSEVVVYKADTFEEVGRTKLMYGIINSLEVFPLKYTPEEEANAQTQGLSLPEQFGIAVGTADEIFDRTKEKEFDFSKPTKRSPGKLCAFTFREGNPIFSSATINSRRPIYGIGYYKDALVVAEEGTLRKYQIGLSPLGTILTEQERYRLLTGAESKIVSRNKQTLNENVPTLAYQVSTAGLVDDDTNTKYSDLIIGDLMLGPQISRTLPESFPRLNLNPPQTSIVHKDSDTHDSMLTCVERVSKDLVLHGDSNGTLTFAFIKPLNTESSQHPPPRPDEANRVRRPNNSRTYYSRDRGIRAVMTFDSDDEDYVHVGDNSSSRKWYFEQDFVKIPLHGVANSITQVRWVLADYLKALQDWAVNGSHITTTTNDTSDTNDPEANPVDMESLAMSVALVGLQDGSIKALYTELGQYKRTNYLSELISSIKLVDDGRDSKTSSNNFSRTNAGATFSSLLHREPAKPHSIALENDTGTIYFEDDKFAEYFGQHDDEIYESLTLAIPGKVRQTLGAFRQLEPQDVDGMMSTDTFTEIAQKEFVNVIAVAETLAKATIVHH